jgi:hypothetical protein
MHTRYADLARVTTAACYRDPAQDDARKVSALVWLLPLVAFWAIVAAAVM